MIDGDSDASLVLRTKGKALEAVFSVSYTHLTLPTN